MDLKVAGVTGMRCGGLGGGRKSGGFGGGFTVDELELVEVIGSNPETDRFTNKVSARKLPR